MARSYSFFCGLKLLLALLLFGTATAQAQAPAWQTAIPAGPYNKMATAMNGDVYVTGNDFISKWSRASGSIVWTRQINAGITAIAVQGVDVYVCGFYSGTVTFDNSTLVSNNVEAFVAKFADTGAGPGWAWAVRGSGIANALAVNGPSIYVTGYFIGTSAQFGGITLPNTSPQGQLRPAFVAKLTDGGGSATWTWAQLLAGSPDGTVSGTAIAAVGSSVYLGGNYNTSTLTLAGSTFTTQGSSFVAKLTDLGNSGSVQWAYAPTVSRGSNSIVALAANGLGVYITGTLNVATRALAASYQFGSVTISAAVVSAIFVAKLTDGGTTGNWVWALGMGGGITPSRSEAIAIRGNNVYVAGGWGVNNMMGATQPGVAKIIDTGVPSTPNWTLLAGNQGDYSLVAKALAMSGSTVYVIGSVRTSAALGSLPLPYAGNFFASFNDLTVSATGLSLQEVAISLYPNPANTQVRVEMPTTFSNATLTLLDALGRALRTETVALPAAGLRHELDLTGLPAGLYAVRVETGPHTATRRLVVE